jgi:hypothetical protein
VDSCGKPFEVESNASIGIRPLPAAASEQVVLRRDRAPCKENLGYLNPTPTGTYLNFCLGFRFSSLKHVEF